MKIVVLGCGRVGAGLVENLHRRGHDVGVIDTDPAAFERLPSSFRGERVLGSALDRSALERAGIRRADCLAAVTPRDEANCAASRVARIEYHVPRVIARLCDPRKADMFRRLGIQTVAPVTWGINRIAELLSVFPLSTVASLGDEIDIAEVDVPEGWAGRTVGEITGAGEFHVVAISRDGKSFLPGTGSRLAPGDRLYVALVSASATRFKTMLGLR